MKNRVAIWSYAIGLVLQLTIFFVVIFNSHPLRVFLILWCGAFSIINGIGLFFELKKLDMKLRCPICGGHGEIEISDEGNRKESCPACFGEKRVKLGAFFDYIAWLITRRK